MSVEAGPSNAVEHSIDETLYTDDMLLEMSAADRNKIKCFEFKDSRCILCNDKNNSPCDGDPVCVVCHKLYDIPTNYELKLNLEEQDCDETDSTPVGSGSSKSLHQDSFNSTGAAAQEQPFHEPEVDKSSLALDVPVYKSEMKFEDLPVEMLMTILSKLDDISLYAVHKIGGRWCDLVKSAIPSSRWRMYIEKRWPLLDLGLAGQDYYAIHMSLLNTINCSKCVIQSFLQIKYNIAATVGEYQLDIDNAPCSNPISPRVISVDSNILTWMISINGPIGSPYEHGRFLIWISYFTYLHMMYPPVVKFLTKVLHPNVSRHGDISLFPCGWSGSADVYAIIDAILYLLAYPDKKKIADPEVGELFLKNEPLFESHARIWTFKYAAFDCKEFQ